MYKISELVGIFEGINFDGKINEVEIQVVNDWLEENRYAAQTLIEMVLMNLLDATFIENEIVEENKEDAITFCLEYTSSPKYINDVSKLFELYGIIVGITCDGVINALEKKSLSIWVSQNKKYIFKGDNKKLIKILGTIYNQESDVKIIQAEITKIIESKITERKLDLKIEYLRELVREGRNLGNAILDLVLEVKDFGYIHKKAEYILDAYLSVYNWERNNEWEYIIISLSIMQMLNYNGNFYNVVWEEYKNIYKKYKTKQKNEGAIRYFISLYSSEAENKRIINPILENTLVPRMYLPDFFDFLYDIYAKNFDSKLPDNVANELNSIYHILGKELLKEEDYVNVLGKQYKLLESTKRIMYKSIPTDGIVLLGEKILKLLDGYLQGELEDTDNQYLRYGFCEWKKKNGSKFNKREITRRKYEKKALWQPGFELIGNDIVLKTPVHNISNCNAYTDIKVILCQNNAIRAYYDNLLPEIREIVGGYKIMEQKITITYPLDKVAYKIMIGEKVVYDSKELLYRSNLLFNEKGKEIQNNTNYSGIVSICCKENISGGTCFFDGKAYKLFNIDAKTVKSVIIGSNIFNFWGSEKSYLSGDIIKNCYIYDVNEQKDLKVYENLSDLFVSIDDEPSKYEIVVDGRPRILTSLKCEQISHQYFRIDLNDFNIGIGIHKLFVYKRHSGNKKCVFKERFSIDNVEFSTKKITDKIYSLNFISSICQHKLENYEINIKVYQSDMLCFEEADTDTQYVYKVPFQLKMYRLDEGPWCSFEENLWAGNVKSSSVLELWGTDYENLAIDNIKHENICCKSIREGELTSVFAIGTLKSYSSKNMISLRFDDGYEIKWYNRCVLDKSHTHISYYSLNKKMSITPVCFGEDKLIYSVYLNDAKVAQGELTNGKETCVDNIEGFKKYKICISAKPRTLLAKTYELLSIEKSFFSMDNLEGKIFPITSLTLESYIVRYEKSKKHTIDDIRHTYIEFLEKCGCDKYRANILIKKKINGYYSLVPLKNINPVEAEIWVGGKDDVQELYLATKDRDGLLFDKVHEGILDADVARDAEDILFATMGIEPIKGVF